MKILYFIYKRANPYYWYHLLRKQKKPADTSNRFWKPIMLWLAFTRYEQMVERTGFDVTQWQMIKLVTTSEELFVEAFPFLEHDIWELLVERVGEWLKES